MEKATKPAIKASELRIGNWFLNPVLPEQVTAESLAVIATVESIIQPIPITPEILEKCGFIGMIGAKYLWVSTDITLKGDGDDVWIYNHWHDAQINFKQPIKYLHQLQNLVFALTGEELNINL